jgi:SPP1 family predicted phage head-tail adaptor
MRFRVTIESRTSVQDASGEQLNTWNLFASRRAGKVSTSGSEQFAAQQQFGRVPTIFAMRYVAGVLPSMRLREGGKVYEIVSVVDPDGGKTEMNVMCEERVGESA